MSENRRNKRKNKKIGYTSKNGISKKEKIFGILAMVAIFLAAVLAVVYFAFNKIR